MKKDPPVSSCLLLPAPSLPACQNPDPDPWKDQKPRSFGYLDELQKVYDDPIAHYTAYVEERNMQEASEDAEYIVKERKDATLPKNTAGRKNFGYIAILLIYYELGLDRLLVNRQRGRNFDSNTSSILKLLVVSRILEPASKKHTFEQRGTYFDFEKEDAFSLLDIYRSLTFFAEIDAAIQLHIHRRITEKYGRNTSLVYYDTTNYYFEIDMEDDLRAKGPSKEHRGLTPSFSWVLPWMRTAFRYPTRCSQSTIRKSCTCDP